MNQPRSRLLRIAETTSWTLGLAGLVVWSAFQIDIATATGHELARFKALQTLAAPGGTPDQALWSPHRILSWRKAMDEPAVAPLAVLRIPKIHLEVPVLPGTDDRTLDRGVGYIGDTALPGTNGNSGIAGHRDGFFRGLKDLKPGDTIELDTLQDTGIYRIERTWVVNPEDVSVLDRTPTQALTLVTCYPFYFVGSAPQRFIVRALYVGEKGMFQRQSADLVSCPQCGSGRPVASFSWSRVWWMVRSEIAKQNGEFYDTRNSSGRDGRRSGLFDGRRVDGANYQHLD